MKRQPINEGSHPPEYLQSEVLDSETDRRVHARVNVDFNVDLEYAINGRFQQVSGIASGLAARGVTVRLVEIIPVGTEVIVRFRIPGGDFPLQFTGRIAWMFASQSNGLHGIQFLHLPSFHKERFYRFLSDRLSSRTMVPERRVNRDELVSELVEFRNHKGQRMTGFHDHLVSSHFDEPIIILPAAYGETKSNSIHAAYYLAKNGFQTLRFDPTNHVGESDGNHEEYKLSGFIDDIHSAVDFAQIRAPNAKIGILASSLAARAAIKAVTTDARCKSLIAIAPILDVRETLKRVQNEDVIQTVLSGEYPQYMNALGHDVKSEGFLGDCVREGFENLETTIADIKKALCPISFIFADQDPWVDERDMAKAVDTLPPSKRAVFKLAAMHKLKENPAEAKRAFRIAVSEASKTLLNNRIKEDTVVEPRLREIGVQVKVERERSRYLTSFSKDDQRLFWSRYLKRFNYIYSIADYRELLDKIIISLGPIKRGSKILDAGCGNGNLGLWLASKIHEKKVIPPISYTGIDIVKDGLENAREMLSQAIESVKSDLLYLDEPINMGFQQVDLNHQLPFLTQTFDKVCCNLVISYLEDYRSAIRELWRVLKPGGRLAITTLKKDADVSRIYRNFIEKASTAEEIDEAKNLLSNAGQIFLKETEGHFRFFEIGELHSVMTTEVGASNIAVDYCFGGQALIFTLEK